MWNEKHQEVVAVGNDSDNSKIENDDIRPKTRAFPNIINSSDIMRESLDSKMNSHSLLRIEEANSNRATPIYTLGGDKSKINETVYELTDAIYKTLSSFSYSGRTLKETSDFLMLYENKNVKGCNGLGERNWKRKTFPLVGLPGKVAE